MNKLLLLILLVVFPVVVFANDLWGTGWVAVHSDGEKQVILFDDDGTFVYIDPMPYEGLEKVWDEDYNTYTVTEDLVVVSFNDGYQLCSMTLNSRRNRMSGTCINKVGLVTEITAELIE